MGNIIYSESDADSEVLNMSNGSTSVLIAVLTLAGADKASNAWERDVLSWIATRDQSIFGIGCVGFDVSELGWDSDDFDAQKAFLLELVQRARNQTGWSRLDYKPDEERVNAMLLKLARLLHTFELSYCRDHAFDWMLPPLKHPVKCSIHGIYLHHEGCVICNDC